MIGARYRDAMYGLMDEVLREIGPRESCSDQERRLGQKLAERWRARGIDVRTERFTCHPKAFLGFIPFTVLLYLAAAIAYWLWPLLSFLLGGAAVLITYFELLRYRELIDPLFPAAEGENVVGVVRPPGEVRQRVVVSAHQDSAYEYNLWFLLKNAAVPILVVSLGAALVPMVGGLAKWLAGATNASHAFNVVGYMCLGLYPLVGLNLFFHTYSVVPGAMDDLAGIGVVDGVGMALTDATRDGQPLLQRTEVVLLAASSEEAGLRGAKRYVSAHAAELAALPSYGLFVDGVYDERFLTVVTRELSMGARHDPWLVQLAKDAAARNGWPIAARALPVGATDACAFSTAGVASVCLLCQDTTRLVPNYHTRFDTLDHVRPESLAVTLQMLIDMLRAIDERES